MTQTTPGFDFTRRLEWHLNYRPDLCQLVSRWDDPGIGERRIRATILYVDRFGNVQLNLTAEQLASVGIEPGVRIEVEVGFERYFASAARTFADARTGDIVVYEDAYRNIALAINQGNAAQMFSVGVGQELRLSVA